MTKGETKGGGVGARAVISFLIVAHATRSELFTSGRLTGGRVTTVTAIVGTQANGNRKRYAAGAGSSVATLTTILRSRRAAHVLSMIKLHIEVLIKPSRKCLQRRGCTFDVAVADNAHRHIRSYELCQVAFRAHVVTWKLWCRSVVRSARVTGGARERCVALARMKEFGVVELRVLR